MRKGAVQTRELRHTVAFGKLSNSSGYSNDEELWVEEFKRRVSLKPISALEPNSSESKSMVVTHVIKCRYTPQINRHHQIKFKERYFTIESILNVDELDHTLILECSESHND